MEDVRFSLCMIVKNEEAVLKDCLYKRQIQIKYMISSGAMISQQPEILPFPRQQGIISILRMQMNT